MVPKGHIDATIAIPIGKILVPLIIERDAREIRFQKVDLSKMGLESLDMETSTFTKLRGETPFYGSWQ